MERLEDIYYLTFKMEKRKPGVRTVLQRRNETLKKNYKKKL